MASRLDLQTELEELLGSTNVYFQPPESVRLKYPCVVFNKNNWYIRNANDFPYLYQPNYQITFIDYDPDADWDVKMMRHFRYVSYDRSFTADNLNHWVFRLYY